MRQDHTEPIRQFAARVLCKGRNCSLTKQCTRTGCDTTLSFSQNLIKLGKTLNQTIAIIEIKEMAARSFSGSIAPPSGVMLRCPQCQTHEDPHENFS